MVSTKTIVLVLLLSFCSQFSMAQDDSVIPKWKEWFKQNATELEYLAEFLATNVVKLVVMNEGNKYQDRVLGDISGDKESSYDADALFIGDLSEVSEVVVNSTELVSIIAHTYEIEGYLAATEELLDDNSVLISLERRALFDNMIDGLRANMTSDISELEMIMFDSDLKFTDDERLSKIRFIFLDYEDKRKFSQLIYQRAIVQINYTKQELTDIQQYELYNTD